MEFKIGQRVRIYNADDPQGGVVGYLVNVYIDPDCEENVDFEAENMVFAKVRFYAPHLVNGYADFSCMYSELRAV